MKSTDGSFSVTGIDHYPVLAQMYAEPEKERKSGFLVELSSLNDGGFRMVDSSTDPVDRRQDYSWKGRIQLPFFSLASVNTWKHAEFFIKDQLPRLGKSLKVDNNGVKYACCQQDESSCVFTSPESTFLQVSSEELLFSQPQTIFTTNKVEAFEVEVGDQLKLDAESLRIASYTDAVLQLKNPVNTDEPYDVDSSAGDIGDCGRKLWTRSVVLDWQHSDNQRDLVCYDKDANCIRGDCESCADHYIAGTYEVRTRTCEDSDNCPETTIMRAENARYYPGLPRLDLSRSDVAVTTDTIENPYSMVINIPSAQLAWSEDKRFIEAAFGATYTEVAASLPYEGAFNFKLDNKCGYYYFHSGGSFTYFLTFRGQTFIVHAPYEFLKQSSPFFMVTDILETLRIRSLYDSQDKFIKAAGLDKVGDKTVISGLLTSGNAKFGMSYGVFDLSVASGPGIYMYQFKNPNATEQYRIGTFMKVIGGASIDIGLMGVGVTGVNTLETRVRIPETLSDFETIRSEGDFTTYGSLELRGCVSALVTCSAALLFPETNFSSSNGLNISGFDTKIDCDTDGCP